MVFSVANRSNRLDILKAGPGYKECFPHWLTKENSIKHKK
jgi:hypothetical protein